MRVDAAEVGSERIHEQLLRPLPVSAFNQLGRIARWVFFGVEARERAPRDAVELERGTRLCRKPFPERSVRIRQLEWLGIRPDVLELASIEGQRLESELRHVDARVLDPSAGVRIAAPCPASLDDERDEVAGHDVPHVARAERHLALLLQEPYTR